jgi:hypothetical protein
MKNIQYILLITLLLLGVGANAVTTLDSNGDTSTDYGATGFGSGSTNTTQVEDTNTTLLGGQNLNTNPLGGLDSNVGGGNGLDSNVGGGNGLNSNVGGSGGGGGGVAGPDIGKPELTIAGFVVWIIRLMNYLVWAMMTAALLVFLYGIVKLMFVDGANEESRSKGKKFILYGIISLFVMASVWGLVNVLKTSIFGTGDLYGPQFRAN